MPGGHGGEWNPGRQAGDYAFQLARQQLQAALSRAASRGIDRIAAGAYDALPAVGAAVISAAGQTIGSFGYTPERPGGTGFKSEVATVSPWGRKRLRAGGAAEDDGIPLQGFTYNKRWRSATTRGVATRRRRRRRYRFRG
jgi:hypothetical protein